MGSYADISLRFHGVAVSRGENALFEGLSFAIESGDVLWIQGANGIGKTTILRLAAGLTRADVGDIQWLRGGAPCKASSIAVMQSHQNALKRSLTVNEELSFWAKIYGFAGNLDAILRDVGLSDKKGLQCGRLSAGQARRLAIARLLVSGKPLWIMDEPAAAMDTAGQALILSVVNAHIARGGAALIASHDTARAFSGTTKRLVLEAA